MHERIGGVDVRTAWAKDVLCTHQVGALLISLDTSPKLIIYLTLLGESGVTKYIEL